LGPTSVVFPSWPPRSAYSIPASPPQYPAPGAPSSSLAAPLLVFVRLRCFPLGSRSKLYQLPPATSSTEPFGRWCASSSMASPARSKPTQDAVIPSGCMRLRRPYGPSPESLRLRRHGQSCPAPYRVQDLFVIWPSVKGLSVIWML
jgi:hypothetical protein